MLPLPYSRSLCAQLTPYARCFTIIPTTTAVGPRQGQTIIRSRGRLERTSLFASVTRQVRPRLMATPRSESATTQCKKKTIPGLAGTGFPENSIGQSIQFGLNVVPNEYPHAA